MNFFIYILFCGSTLLLAFLLLVNPQKVNTKGNLWLGMFVFSLFLLTVEEALEISHHTINETLLSFITLACFVVAPVFFLSVCYFIAPERKWKKTNFLHFGFAFVMLLSVLLSMIENAPDNDDTSPELKKTISLVFNLICCTQLFLYVVVSYRKIVNHRKHIRLYSSSVENIDLKWLQYIGIGVVLMASVWALEILLGLSETNVLFDTLSNIAYLFGILLIAYHAMKQKEIYPFSDIEKNEILEIVSEIEMPVENRKKLVSDDKLEEIKNALMQLIATEKPYLDCELSLVKLAQQMNLSTHLLSYTINTGFDENFYQFINRYRIDEAKKMVLDPQMGHLNLVGIAFAVGFNSKTAFNTAFKKATGQTPSEFKKSTLLPDPVL
ncbi:MAG TPA: helix-turn-helix domain-containing protein [Flavobacterium sp.]|nr:helix-turn-helix domain-containing protein [Flavobacterium sp.]HPJ11656.1 helix-turn-helix domain-containing protein [Flavobacterium sp.]